MLPAQLKKNSQKCLNLAREFEKILQSITIINSKTMTGQLNPITVGILFQKKEDLKRAWQSHASRENFENGIVKSDRSRITIKCSGEA